MPFNTKVVGVTYDNPDGKNRQDIIKGLTTRSNIALERDYANLYDPNAIRVVDSEGNQLGFLGRDISANLAPRMDKGEVITASISALTGGGDYTCGVNILINA